MDDDLNARSEKWRRTGQPSVLWPGIDARALDPAAEAIASSVACCLDGRRSSLGSADGADARVIGVAALILGVGPLLGYWIERGLLDVSAPLADVLAAHLGHCRARLVRMVDGLRPVADAFAASGIAPLVIKGFHAAHVYFPEPGVRPLADVDMVVRAAEIADVERILSSLGFAPGRAERPFKRPWRPPGTDDRIRSFELWHADSPWALEVHGGLFFSDQHRYGVDFGDALAQTDACHVGGIAARALTPPLRLVATATHFLTELQVMRLLRLVEMVLMIRSVGAPNALDWTAVVEILDRSRATRFAHPAFALLERLAPGTVPSHVLDRARRASSRVARHVVENLKPATPVLFGGYSLAHKMMWVSSPAQFFSRMGGLLAPDMEAPSWREACRVYEFRLRRLLTGRVSVRFHR